MFKPTLKEFKEKSKKGNLIPVYKEILADLDTPVSAYMKMSGGDYSFLLESVEGGEKWARYCFLGFDGLILRQEEDQWKRLTINSNHEFYGFYGFGPDDMYICGSDGIIYKFNGNSVTEMPTRTQDFFLDIWGPSKEMVFAIGDLGMIMFNDGEQWTRIESNTEEYLTALWGSSDEDMYAVGDNGLILHWNGENWSACV